MGGTVIVFVQDAIKHIRNGFLYVSLLLHPYGEKIWSVSFLQYIYFKGGRAARTHAATMVRAKLTGAWVKKQDRERA